MRAVDTNVLARLLLMDDPVQHAIAVELVEQPFWIVPTVWLELGWLLHKKLKLSRPVVAEMLFALLATETVNTSDEEGLRWAIDRFAAGADWADAIHLIVARHVASSLATFDHGIAPALGDQTPITIETL